MKRSRFWIIGAVVAAGGGAVFLAGQMRGGPATSYESLAVDRGPIVSRISASGAVSARTTVLVGSQVSGRLSEMFVDFNSEVKKGQLLARIDPRLFEAGVEQSRANLMAARAQLARARAQSDLATRDLERKRVLAERRLIATVDLDTSGSQADVAAAEVQAASGSVAQASANLRQAEINLAMTDIVSPIDGVVISRDVDVGQTVAASLQAPTLFTLAADLRQMQVDTDVAESDVARIESGKTAEFTVDAYPGRTFQGTIREIRNAPKTTQNVVTYNAVIDVDNPDLALKPGMTASVSFVLASRDNVLRLPNAALRYRPSSGPPGPKGPAVKKGPLRTASGWCGSKASRAPTRSE
ncbi:efflux RND transporter periplasmic adaptor subunit [Vulgatibacter incomptus]|uniref:Macrolide-specific efflux protein MacA n=1 Tax=Vulgatibacter incomptus TaxID=1391653 RepID=A0A0K1PBT5_9BACT|nr:efflux RND transporter periplasmic adaptor subunit [Vulgatibacter incomptus]AKU90866.1 Macrolide-specific efflux protein MacA [Vulgatibacter incomptus]